MAIDVAKAWNAVLIEKRDGTHQHFRVANSHGASVRHFEPTAVDQIEPDEGVDQFRLRNEFNRQDQGVG